MTGGRLRADRLLVERGHFESRTRAQDAIRAGLVTANGQRIAHSSDRIDMDAEIVAQPVHPFVSRGALKLAAALDAFALTPDGAFCLDIGASTGGFTDLLLRRGARHVVTVDVGRDQLHHSLRDDSRVTVFEATDIRKLAMSALPCAADLAVIDVSFISLQLVLPAAKAFLAPGAAVIALIKPQFEAGRGRIGNGGLVRDESVHADVCKTVQSVATELGFTILGLIPSPIAGGDGNREFLIGLRNPAP